MHFGWIDNIHGVRNAYERWFPIWKDQWYSCTYDEILDKLNSINWVEAIRILLKNAKYISNVMAINKKNVIVHWSDGWDRTAQLCSLTQIMIDPYFRTLKGLEVIIEKEWVSFGFQFHKRCGNFKDDSHEKNERSPVFIQFMDCLFQLLEQFPSAFQYNKNVLKFLALNVYTWKFGTFICDNEWSRIQLENKLGFKFRDTVSIWTYVNDNWSQFLNPFYTQVHERLDPHCYFSSIKFWEDHFLSWYEHDDEKGASKSLQPRDDRASILIDQHNKEEARILRDKKTMQDKRTPSTCMK